MSPVGQPNYLTVNPDGTVGANFAGHISAQGLDLPAAILDTPQPVNVVQWLRQNPADSQRVGDLYAYNDNSLQEAALCAAIQAPDTPARLAEIDLFAELTTASAGVSVAAQDEGHPQPRKTLLTSAGASDWVMDSDTPPAASDLQSTYGAGLVIKSGAVTLDKMSGSIISVTSVQSGPTYGSAGTQWTNLICNVPVGGGHMIAGWSGMAQNNGTNGTLYGYYWRWYLDGVAHTRCGACYGTTNGQYVTAGGGAFAPSLTAGSHTLSLRVEGATATPTWGGYYWQAWAYVIPA